MVKRMVSKDTCLGFGICVMIIVHLFTQQIGGSDPGMFIPLVNQMSLFTLITLLPLMIMGTWGSIFTLFTCTVLTMQVKHMDPQDNLRFGKFLFGRLISGILMISLFRLYQWIFRIYSYDSMFKEIRGFNFNFASNTLDSIAIVGFIIPCVVFGILKIKKCRNVKVFTGIFIFLTFVSLGVGSLIIPWGRQLCLSLNAKGFYFLEYWVSKLVWGRFKIAYTFAFGCMGAFVGYLYDSEQKETHFIRFMLIFSLSCMAIVGIVALWDWSFIQEYASLDTPLIVQFFNLGGQGLLFTFFIKLVDSGGFSRRMKNSKRTIWLRRYGIVSLTIYSVGAFLANILFRITEFLFGPALDTGSDPILNWNSWQIYGFILFVFLSWEIVLRIWEKMHYAFSIEWMMTKFTALVRLKKNASLYVQERLYYPCKPEFYHTYKEKSRILLVSNR